MTFFHFLRIVEIRTKIVSVSSLLIGTAFVFYSRIPFDPTAFVLLVISVLAIDMGTTAFNTFFDYLSGVRTFLVSSMLGGGQKLISL